jgi:DNA-binding transcriptional MerR regulator
MGSDTDVIRAFTEDQAARLTGLTVHRLRHWDRTGFFVPSFAAKNRRSPFSRVYSFKDLLSLQILKALRLDQGCSLQHLREVKTKLAHLGEERWARTILYVLNKKVVFRDEANGELREAVSGQMVFQIPLKVVRANMKSAVAKLNQRDSADFGRIERKRNVNHNAAVIAGIRIPMSAIKRLSEDGFNTERILKGYPPLTKADVDAALRYSKEKHAA